MSCAPVPAVLPRPPIEPALEDCCGSGCSPCIFDLYQDALERHEALLAAWHGGAAAAAARPPGTGPAAPG